MISNFQIELAGGTFRFLTMNVKALKLFEVYVMHDGKDIRFHMQRKGEGDFYITDPDKVPEPYKGLETELNAAIFQHNANV